MPNPGADAPLRKCTLNLYEEDCSLLEITYGWGWSEIVRAEVHAMVIRLKEDNAKRKRYLGDLDV